MYRHKNIEKKWQNYWEENNTFKVENDFTKPKYYTLDMFPFPSGAGLHVGHPEGMTANDIVARYKTAKGFNVLHPMGWDAFGLPAENYAIKTGTHPKITTKENIDNFRKQIKALGFSYDWNREVNTTDPKYYKWTQWIFLKLYEKGLAYEQDLPINYCPSCKTGLANEEVLNDFTCERCGTKVEKKKIRQWVLAITKYADRLLNDVDKLDWPEGIKDMQRNWIGKSEGCEFSMKVVTGSNPSPHTSGLPLEKEEKKEIGKISVYTTRIDTVFGMTYAVLAPDHKDVMDFITEDQKQACLDYIDEANKKSDQDRTQDDKEKTGVFTGSYVINPYNGKEVPLWIGDYVLGNYGTGAVMAVPAHDTRDFAFAKKYDLEIIESVAGGDISKDAFTNLGTLINSGNFDGLSSKVAQSKLTQFAEENNFGTKKINYKLRDWLFSRQRYWGEPIPLIHLDKANLQKLEHISNLSEAIDKNKAYLLKRKEVEGEDCTGAKCPCLSVRELVIDGKVFSKVYDGIYGKTICDYRLPLELPEVEDFAPAGDGQSPLANVDDFVNVKLAENLSGKRETNTMPQWGGSCWYYLRYMNNDNDEMLVDPKVEKYWGQVDSYVGGAEHAVLHLLYARFWHKFLFDIGVVSSDEPFYRLRNQGLITAHSYQNEQGKLIANDLVKEKDGKYFDTETGEELKQVVAKMSKSLKNVINPDDIVEEYGADSLRLYEMYMAEFKDSAPWDTKGIVGVRRFLEKVERAFNSVDGKIAEDDDKAMRLMNKTIRKVEEDIEKYKFNTAIAAMIICVNYGRPKDKELFEEWKYDFVKILNPFAPHLAEELFAHSSIYGNGGIDGFSVSHLEWPQVDENMLEDEAITIAVQVLGKVRGTIEISKDEDKDYVLEKARTNEDVIKWLEGKDLVKEIYVPGKIVNLVVK